MKGGHGEGQAKHLGAKTAEYQKMNDNENRFNLWTKQFAQHNPEPKNFDREKFAYFFADDAATDRESISYFTHIGTYIDEKTIRLSAAMDENPRWVGSQGLIESYVDTSSFVIFRDGVSVEPGARPMAALFTNNSKRSGPFAVPQPTLGSINYCSTNTEEEIWFHLAKLREFVKVGVTYDRPVSERWQWRRISLEVCGGLTALLRAGSVHTRWLRVLRDQTRSAAAT